ncbi:MAG: hypothetical protein ABI638_12115 [Ignavibacteriota bacterium]
MEIIISLGFIGLIAFVAYKKFKKSSKGKIAVNNFFLKNNLGKS